MNPRRYRHSRGLTLKAMAKLVGAANQGTVSKHELGQIFPSPEYIEKYREVSNGLIQYEDWIEIRRNPPAPGDFEDMRDPTPDEMERKRA